ncbi:hypothetical protein GCM10009776_14240 [Microbacterium deminutum]|uniref:Gram-positive cocci surface proteins LPxTG domain-containing protein n=1 Tax=Microbacterium deminutum TaxID=344164 RepID=A0ABN2QJR2_9MICO
MRARVAAAVTCATLLLSGAIAGAAPAAQAAGSTTGSVTGVVFQDLSSEGWFTSGSAATGVPRSRPVEGITATAYDADGDMVGSALSGADGTYSLPVAGAFSADLRIEFSGWPDQYEPAFAAQGAEPPSVLGANDTSVQFVALDGAGEATGVDFGLVIPDQVVQTNAPIATAIQYAGLRTSTAAGMASVVAQPWSLIGSSDAANWPPPARQTLATYGQVGSTWGLTYNRITNAMIIGSVFKRMSDLGSLGLGGIYRVDDVLAPDGSITAGTTAQPWFSVQGLPVSGGGTIDLGQSLIPADRGLGAPADPARDISAFQYAARVGMGGIATSLDGETLFVTDLNDRQIYAINVTDPTQTPSQAFRVATPVGTTQQLWALTEYSDRLYMGFVDTGVAPGVAAADANMQAYVVSVPTALARSGLNSGVIGAGPADWRLELQTSLGYAKGSNMQQWPGWDSVNNRPVNCSPGSQPPTCAEEQYPQLKRWNSWADEWRWAGGSVGIATSWSATLVALEARATEPGHTQAYPQPILSGLAFDIDGYLNIGFADRTQLQSGNRNVGAYTTPDLPNQALNALWETVANGDTLVAAPASLGLPVGDGCPTVVTGRFALECNGKVGQRDVRTTTSTQVAVGTNPDGTPIYQTVNQALTYNNVEGPRTGEFLNDRRGLGTQGIHNDNTLGSVVTYPGVDEVASTATDPLDGIYRSGLMWFDQRNGAATRGFDEVRGTNDAGSPAFQKGGGLGAVSLLGVGAPVEIGNRVWLDADLNGRQDSDEPAINGAPVQLWTDDGTGSPACLIGATTTATIDGQPGTYYFRSDDPALQNVPCAGRGPVSFTQNADYIVVFPPGTGAVALQGPNAAHEGFVGLTWGDLVRTTQAVRIAPTATNGGTTEVNDSNPDLATGEARVTVGGPAQNDHTIDAGWYGIAPYEVLKTVTGPAPPNATYTVVVGSAVNFRGQDRLGQSGQDPGGRDPQVTATSFDLTPGVPAASGQDLPYGYTLTFSENEALPDGAITFTPSVPNSSPPQGRLVVAPTTDGTVTLDVENSYGSVQVSKTLAGDAEAIDAVADLEFTVTWTSDQPDLVGGATSGSFPVPGDGTPVPEPALTFPTGTVVQLTEVPPTDLPPGVDWSGLTWTPAPNVTVSADGLTATVTVAGGAAQLTTAALTNTFTNALGSFTVSKQVEGDFALDDPAFDDVSIPINYSYTDLATGEQVTGALTLDRANGFTANGPTLPEGTVVTVEEGTPTGGPPDLEWGAAAWTVDGVATDAPVSLTIGADTTAELVVTNQVSQLVGTFAVIKDFSGDFTADDPALADVVITIHWDGGGLNGDLELTQAEGWTASPTDADGNAITFPLGTVVTVTETGRTGGPPDLVWGNADWGSNANPADPTQGLVTITSDVTPTPVTLTNDTTQLLGTFSVAKHVTGDFDLESPELAAAQFTIHATWDGGSTEIVLNQANGWASGLGRDLPTGTVVTLSEIQISGAGPSVDWGVDAAWSGEGITVNPDGTASITIGDGTNPEITVTNTATELLGTFSIHKRITGSEADTLPADFSFTVTYTYDGLAEPGVLVVHKDETVTSPPIPVGTVVTISEVVPSGTLPAGGSWGTPVFVLPDGSSTAESTTITIAEDQVAAVELQNPTLPPLPATGGGGASWAILVIATLLLLGGGSLFVVARRRRTHTE